MKQQSILSIFGKQSNGLATAAAPKDKNVKKPVPSEPAKVPPPAAQQVTAAEESPQPMKRQRKRLKQSAIIEDEDSLGAVKEATAVVNDQSLEDDIALPIAPTAATVAAAATVPSIPPKMAAVASTVVTPVEPETLIPSTETATASVAPEPLKAEPATKVATAKPKARKRKNDTTKASKKGELESAAAVENSGSDKVDSEEPSSISSSSSEGKKATKKGRKASEKDAEVTSPTINDVLMASTKKAKSNAAAKGNGANKVEGVGLGALEAAVNYASCNPQSLVTWKPGEPVPYSLLAETFETIASTSKRLSIITSLVTAFRAIISTTPADLLPAVYLCTNRVAPAHTGIELGVGEALLIKALAQATGRQESAIKHDYEVKGDLGVVAVACRSTQRTMFTPAPLTVTSVLRTFTEIASASGQASVERKKGMVVKLLAASKGNEAGYIMRSLQAKLRIGLAEQSVLVALGHATVLEKPGEGTADKSNLAERLEAAARAVKHAYSECPSYDVLVPAILNHPLADLALHCHFMPGVPIRPMLAKATNGVSEVLEKFGDGEFTCEYKYDGERAQVHVLEDGSVKIFSRNAEDNTGKYPDLVARISSHLTPGTKSIVFDSEAVAIDKETGRILPFQTLSTRARKDVQIADIRIHVCLYAFDCLYKNGVSLLARPLTERRLAMSSGLTEKQGELMFATTKTSRDVEELEGFLNEAIEGSTEGLIVKTTSGSYEPARRSNNWLKLKKDYMEGVGDTIDVVPIGAFHGRGKRAGVYGAYLLAVYDPDDDVYCTISKLGTGFSDEMLISLADSLRPHLIPQPRPYYRWGEALQPDVWFDTAVVWEVKAADLSISPVYQAAAGLVDPTKGISMRFPRLVRVRDDKKPDDATTVSQVAEMYRSQASQREHRKKAQEAEDDAEDDGN